MQDLQILSGFSLRMSAVVATHFNSHKFTTNRFFLLKVVRRIKCIFHFLSVIIFAGSCSVRVLLTPKLQFTASHLEFLRKMHFQKANAIFFVNPTSTALRMAAARECVSARNNGSSAHAENTWDSRVTFTR